MPNNRKDHYENFLKTRVQGPLSDTSTTGAIAELEVSADLMKQGFEVFRALSPSASCDLIAMKDHRCFRIQVRCTYRSKKSGEIYVSQADYKPSDKHEIVALKVSDGITYIPPLT